MWGVGSKNTLRGERKEKTKNNDRQRFEDGTVFLRSKANDEKQQISDSEGVDGATRESEKKRGSKDEK